MTSQTRSTMHTTYRVTSSTGSLLGTYTRAGFAAIRTMLDANPGAIVTPVVRIDNPCAAHPAFEADYCPSCGTARQIGTR